MKQFNLCYEVFNQTLSLYDYLKNQFSFGLDIDIANCYYVSELKCYMTGKIILWLTILIILKSL